MANSVKAVASTAIDSNAPELEQLSDEIWKNPELADVEYKAHDLLTNYLEKKGFTVERSFTGIKTAFRATFGSGRPNVCVICEYDALPEIGHACGHNLIAEAGIAAGLGLKAVLESPNAPKGMVTVMGTPAEEAGGGKAFLIENGAFKDIDVAIMVHPCPFDVIKTKSNSNHTTKSHLHWQSSTCSSLPLGGSECPGCSCDGLYIYLCSSTTDEAILESTWYHHKWWR